MEVAVHPPGGGLGDRRGPPVGVPLQEDPPLQEAVFRQYVEGVAGPPPARERQQLVDQGEGVGGVGAVGTAVRTPCGLLHHPVEAGVHEPQERSEPPGLRRRELGAVPVPAVDPRVQGVAAAADHRDRAAVGVLDGRGDGDAERLEVAGGAVLASDRVAVAVQVVLEEVVAAGGHEAVAVVEQALGHGLAGERLARVAVVAQQGADGRRRDGYR